MIDPAEAAARAGLALLARPVAHSLNNAMMVLFGNLDLLRQSLPADSPGQARVERALAAADRLKVGEGHGPVHHFHAIWKDG